MTQSSLRSVICIGALHHDTIVHARESIRSETSTPAVFTHKPGGVAANVARGLNKLGVKTTLIGALGRDGAAAALTQQLAEEGLTLTTIERSTYPTGQYIAFHDPDGALTAACVDDRILSEAPADLLDPILKDTSKADASALWFADANLPEELLLQVAKLAPQKSLVANAVSNSKAHRLKPVLGSVSLLLLNRGEARALTGSASSVANEKLVEDLLELGPAQIILTDAAKDVLVYDGTTVQAFSPPAAKIVDVTGAGDALTAGLLAALARGYSLLDAVPAGLKAAQKTLSSPGALAENLTWENIHPG